MTIAIPPPTEYIASPPLSPNTAKKRGLWGRLRGKKKDDVEFETPQATPPSVDTGKEAEKATGIACSDVGLHGNLLNVRFTVNHTALDYKL